MKQSSISQSYKSLTFRISELKYTHSSNGQVVFYIKSVMPELYELNWCVIFNIPSVYNKTNRKSIYFDTPANKSSVGIVLSA